MATGRDRTASLQWVGVGLSRGTFNDRERKRHSRDGRIVFGRHFDR